MTSNDEYVIQLLTERGYLTQDQVDAASQSMKAENETTLDVLLSGGTIGEDEVLGTIADQFGLKYCHINADAISGDVTQVIPADIAKKYGVVPVVASEDSVTVALLDPMGYDAIDSLRYVLSGKDIEAVLSPIGEVRAAMAKLYPSGEDAEVLTRDEEGVDGSEAIGDDAPVIKLATLIITNAIKMKASDIHIEPMEKEFRVRYRIDGALRKMDSPPKRLQGAIISRFKIMSKMKISEKRIPQDGRIQITVGGKDLDLRVSSVPTNHGESIVMRILDKSNLSLGLPQLGFLTDDQATFERLIKLPDGVVLVTGPTGSGKSTSLYSFLSEVNKIDVRIMTAEDPIEYHMAGINQVQMQSEIGMTFARALRAFLRQDPDIIMVGEIRDRETAEIAINASLTGHMVFSTLHTNDAAGAFPRLIDMGVEPFLIASAVAGVMGQRLCRRLCPECRREVPLDRKYYNLDTPPEKDTVFEPNGCEKCSKTGYRGRRALFEVLEVDEDIEGAIVRRENATQIRNLSLSKGMKTLREDGWAKVFAGVTSVKEILRVTEEQ